MKFGKRLSAEAERQWRDSYIDYKACKRAIQADVEAKDPLGHTFHSVILQELDKVSAFYQAKEEELQAGMLLLGPTPGKDKVASFASQVLHLRKYVVLNYVCVVKACKKRNRHLRAACGEQVASVHAVDILSKQYFFTSPKLASMATQAEILTKGLQPVTPSLLQDYQCPICLSTLRGPVVLTCVHRFCWGCIVTHCTTLLGRRSQGPTALGQDGGAMAGDDDKGSKAGEGGSSSSRVDSAAQRAGTTATWEGEQSDDEHTLATFDCPVCRKAQLLNLDRLQVDPHLDAFVRKLEQQGQGAVSSSSTVTMLEDREDMLTCEPQHDAQPSGAPATPHGQGGVSEPATSTVVAPLSVEAMDAVVEYLHKEHQALQEESRLRQQAQQTVAAHPPSPEHVAAALPPLPQQQQQQQQRAVSQPMTISSSSPSSSSKGQQPESWRQQGLVDDMEVDSKPSMHSRLLAASEASAEEVSSQLRSVPAPVPAAIIPSRQQEPQVVERRPPHAATVISQAPARLPAAAPAAPKVVVQQAAVSEPPLLPPQRPQDVGKLTVCLDLDGTLVSTFTPKRAPLLPPSAVSYVVGRGGKLNPGGVFVVERPGLLEFFRRIAPVAEVVLFTAGLEDYAAPICDALEAKYNCFLHRLYRPACVPDEVYPCIKDMSRLGRDLKRCVLVDDTPLAFFRQPDNGIPVLNFRGDVDDQLLAEAVAPLIESLAGVPDVRIALSRRFNMTKWFQAQGLMVPKSPPLPVHRTPSMPVMHRTASGPAAAPAQAQRPQAAVQLPSNADVLHEQRTRGVLLICDFDKTLTDNDAGERLCDELAPELTSLLTQLEMPANFVPVTNTVLGEMQRRGVSRDRILATLHKMGGEVPLASVRMLQWASRVGIDVRVLSDCNSVVINSVLAGAKVNKCVREIITNYSAFQRVDEVQQSVADLSSQQQQPSQPGSWLYRTFGGGSSSSSTNSDGRGMAAVLVRSPPKQATQRLVVTPRHPYHECSHGCPLCPENLCKGQEMEALWKTSGRRQRTIYCGDGANDLCPALRLGPQDVVLARKGYQLDHLISKRAGAPDGVRRVVAQVELWETHEDLWRLVQEAVCI